MLWFMLHASAPMRRRGFGAESESELESEMESESDQERRSAKRNMSGERSWRKSLPKRHVGYHKMPVLVANENMKEF